MFHCLPNSAWADGNLAEAARSWARWVKHQNHSQPNPCLRAHGTPCRGKAKILKISRTSNSHPDANLCLPFSGNNLCDGEQYNFRNAWNVQLTTVSVQIGRLSLHEARILLPLLMRTRALRRRVVEASSLFVLPRTRRWKMPHYGNSGMDGILGWTGMGNIIRARFSLFVDFGRHKS